MPYGNLLADVVQSSTVGTPPQFNDGGGTQTGTLCRAWLTYNGSSPGAVRASFNISSVTYNSAGTFTVNFTTAFVDANYCIAGAQQANSGSGQTGIAVSSTNPTTTSVQLRTPNVGAAYTDTPYAYAAFFR